MLSVMAMGVIVKAVSMAVDVVVSIAVSTDNNNKVLRSCLSPLAGGVFHVGLMLYLLPQAPEDDPQKR